MRCPALLIAKLGAVSPVYVKMRCPALFTERQICPFAATTAASRPAGPAGPVFPSLPCFPRGQDSPRAPVISKRMWKWLLICVLIAAASPAEGTVTASTSVFCKSVQAKLQTSCRCFRFRYPPPAPRYLCCGPVEHSLLLHRRRFQPQPHWLRRPTRKPWRSAR